MFHIFFLQPRQENLALFRQADKKLTVRVAGLTKDSQTIY